jgi:hypothetical protein
MTNIISPPEDYWSLVIHSHLTFTSITTFNLPISLHASSKYTRVTFSYFYHSDTIIFRVDAVLTSDAKVPGQMSRNFSSVQVMLETPTTPFQNSHCKIFLYSTVVYKNSLRWL